MGHLLRTSRLPAFEARRPPHRTTRGSMASLRCRSGLTHPWPDGAGGAVLRAEAIAEAVRGALLRSGPPGCICTDTRKLCPGDWFLALRGANFDGEEFLQRAAELGCAGAIGTALPSQWSAGFVQVENGLVALQELAATVRRAFPGPVVAITGSSGKTTARAMTALALQSLGHIHSTSGNLNNHVGVPLTLLAMPSYSAACVLELGMNHAGEIAELAEIAAPDIRLILNAGPVHLEGVGTIADVARAKGELFATARPGDICIANADDELIAALPVPQGTIKFTFGSQPDCLVHQLDVKPTARGRGLRAAFVARRQLLEQATVDGKQEPSPQGDRAASKLPGETAEVEIDSPGLHLAANVNAALAVAVCLGVPLSAAAEGVSHYVPVGRRMRLEEVVVLGPGRRTASQGHSERTPAQAEQASCVDVVCGNQDSVILLLDDAYNANPMSTRAALELLAGLECPGKRVACLGDMLELGPASVDAHCQVLQAACSLQMDMVFLTGECFQQAAIWWASRPDASLMACAWKPCSAELASMATALLGPGDAVLVKGSRAIRMEQVADAIRRLGQPSSEFHSARACS
eukprot:SM000039S14486  [mRNA]  locus=s39:461581:464154:+ [translate_table: standard]